MSNELSSKLTPLTSPIPFRLSPEKASAPESFGSVYIFEVIFVEVNSRPGTGVPGTKKKPLLPRLKVKLLSGASCKIIWNASHNPSQIEVMYLESIRRFT